MSGLRLASRGKLGEWAHPRMPVLNVAAIALTSRIAENARIATGPPTHCTSRPASRAATPARLMATMMMTDMTRPCSRSGVTAA
jgi:hypothetical protein